MIPHAEGAFYSESGLKILSGRQLTYPKGNDTYAEDGSAEDDIETEDSSGRARFRYGGQWWRGRF